MDLPSSIRNNSRNIRQNIAIVARGGIRNGRDIVAGQRVRIRNLFWIDGRALRGHLDVFSVLPNRLQANFHGHRGSGRDTYVINGSRVKTLTFDHNFVWAGRQAFNHHVTAGSGSLTGNNFSLLLNGFTTEVSGWPFGSVTVTSSRPSAGYFSCACACDSPERLPATKQHSMKNTAPRNLAFVNKVNQPNEAEGPRHPSPGMAAGKID